MAEALLLAIPISGALTVITFVIMIRQIRRVRRFLANAVPVAGKCTDMQLERSSSSSEYSTYYVHTVEFTTADGTHHQKKFGILGDTVQPGHVVNLIMLPGDPKSATAADVGHWSGVVACAVLVGVFILTTVIMIIIFSGTADSNWLGALTYSQDRLCIM